MGAGLVVLSRDEALIHTVRVLSPQYQVCIASTESDLAAHLLRKAPA